MEMQKLARDIYGWCVANNLWMDNTIYFNGKAWSYSSIWGNEDGKKIGYNLYEYENKNPLTYFEYANPETLSMSFEGPLNHVLNGYTHGWTKLEKQFSDIFEKYGMYYEMGYNWSLSTYKL